MEGATAVAHGCNGKANDEVRLELGVRALDPSMRVIAPAREWGMSRAEEIEYAKARRIPIPSTIDSPYSVDANLWGRSIERGVLEDPWQEPPEDIYALTRSPQTARRAGLRRNRVRAGRAGRAPTASRCRSSS